MLLAIDTGNTNVKFALVNDDGSPRSRWRIATDARRTADEYAVWLLRLIELEGLSAADVTDVAVSTVVPRALYNIQSLSLKYFGVDALVAGRAPMDYGIALDVDEPQSVGSDRACNAIGAHAAHAGDLIIISFGTATTVDHVDFNGAYKGGIIAPGLNLSLDALVAATAKLPRIAIEAPASDSVIGRTTQSQMLIGIYWGYVAMIEGLVSRMKAEIGRPVQVIATGGLAALFQQHSHLFDSVDADLTLKGLSLLWRRSTR
jgi:type III pantothenate kinase